jgi:hypothetical protein
LYLALDVAAIRPLMQMGLAQVPPSVQPAAKQFLDALNLVTSAELTVNVVTPGPTSLVVQGNDEPAAQQIETMLQEAAQKMRTTGTPEQPGPPADDPVQQAMGRYKERMLQHLQPLRNGTSVTCMKIDGQDPSQRLIIGIAMAQLTVAAVMPAIQVARNSARKAQAAKAGSTSETGPESPPGAPASPPRQ